jgi:hypothetical protein
MQPMMILHIAGGLLAIVAGYTALFSRKGQSLHRRAGLLFVAGMLAMGSGAAIVGLVRDKPTWLGGLTVIYYVLTGLRTVRRSGPPTRFDLALSGYAVALVMTWLAMTVRYTMSPTAESARFPLPVALITPTVLLLAVRGDVRERRSGPLTGNRRLSRHIWRMCYPMFVATASFFLGQAKTIPAPVRIWPLLFVLAFVPLVVMFYWMWRVRRRSPKMATVVSRTVMS